VAGWAGSQLIRNGGWLAKLAWGRLGAGSGLAMAPAMFGFWGGSECILYAVVTPGNQRTL